MNCPQWLLGSLRDPFYAGVQQRRRCPAPVSNVEQRGDVKEANMADTYVIKVENGNAKLYKSNGAFVRSLCSGAQSGVVSGDEAHVTMKDGKVKIYGVKNGDFKRTI